MELRTVEVWMEPLASQRLDRCCRRPDLNIFDGNRVCLSCGNSSIVSGAELEASNNDFEVPDDNPESRVEQSDDNYELIRELRRSGSTETGDVFDERRRKLPYQYHSISDEQDIRLVRIQPGSSSDPIRCRIEHVSLKSAPIYDAVSYTWGDTNGTAQLQATVSVFSDGRYYLVPVTTNCGAALRRVRLPDRERHVFIDALCINQSDMEERRFQVRLMPKIYSNAHHVVIYVGEESDQSDEVMDLLNRFGVVPHPIFYKPRYPPEAKTYAENIESFLSRSWFSRVWILQEVGMAQRALLVCGSKSIPWERIIISGLNRPRDNPLDYRGLCPPVLSLSLNGQQPIQKMYRLLSDARKCSATDPRDKVYAVYGLLEGSNSAGLSADYTKSTELVYTNTAKFLITQYNSLDILGLVEPRAFILSTIPSWVPDWRVPTIPDPLFQPLTWGYSDQGQASFTQNDAKMSVLHTQGYVIGSVSSITEEFKPLIDLGDPSVQGSRWRVIPESWGSFPVIPDIEEWIVTLSPDNPEWLTSLKKMCDQDGGSYNTPADPFADQFNSGPKRALLPVDGEESVRDVILRSQRTKKKKMEEDSQNAFDPVKVIAEIILAWLKHHEKIVVGRRFFVTAEGHFGIGPPTLAIGDKLCKLEKASIPHFLRKQSNDKYTFVGECFGGIRREDLGQLLIQFPNFKGLPSTEGLTRENIAIW